MWYSELAAFDSAGLNTRGSRGKAGYIFVSLQSSWPVAEQEFAAQPLSQSLDKPALSSREFPAFRRAAASRLRIVLESLLFALGFSLT